MDAMTRIEAVIFDMDGTLTDSEHWWDEVRRGLAAEDGRPWPDDATTAQMGMSTQEWATYLVEVVGLQGPWTEAARRAIDGMVDKYRAGVPLLQGADESVRRMAARGPIAICSSSPRKLIDAVSAEMGWDALLSAKVSTEEVPRGKPHPDGHLRAAELLGIAPENCVVIEDATNGIKSAINAGMKVVAVPPHFNPPSAEVLASADAVIDSLDELTDDLLDSLAE